MVPKHLLLAAAIFSLAACTQKFPTVIENPYYSYKNTNSIVVTAVEKTDTATILSIDALYIPHYWISIDGQTTLNAGGKQYALLGGEGITPGEQFYLPDSGRGSFKLLFEPVDPATRSVDFIEGEIEGAFRIFDIDLTGKKEPREIRFPKHVPTPQLVSGESTLIVDFGFLKGRYKPDADLYLNTFFPPEQQQLSGKIDDKGLVTFKFHLNGPASAFIAHIPGIIRIAPGERVTVHPEGAGWKDSPLSYKGEYASAVMPSSAHRHRFNALDGHFAADATSGAEYAAFVKERYTELCEEVAADNLSDYEKEYLSLLLKKDALTAVSMAGYIKRVQYERDNGTPEGFSAPEFTPEDCAWMKELHPEDLRLLLVDNSDMRISRKLSDILFEGEENYITEGEKARALLKKAQACQPFSEEENAAFEALTYPVYKDGILAAKEQAEALAANTPSSVKTVPDVAAEQLLDAILAQYRGECVLVDIWATWCGPCRAAHKLLEPKKRDELKDVRFVYLTSETSPKTKWLEMIPQISGDHYYLSSEQLHVVMEQLASDGFPTYLIVNRDGSRKETYIGFDPAIIPTLAEASERL